ncbi:hypothetical protein M758_12G003700 [Ceratodon purpureus]|nr:hypothetical protein M758_12G003700 [Ceratodon purpureus]
MGREGELWAWALCGARWRARASLRLRPSPSPSPSRQHFSTSRRQSTSGGGSTNSHHHQYHHQQSQSQSGSRSGFGSHVVLKRWLSRALSFGKQRVGGIPYFPVVLGFAASGCLGTGLLVVFADDHNTSHNPPGISNTAGTGKKKVIVLGTGWGGMSFLKNLDSTLYDVRVVSPRNYFVFTPLLPSVTSGSVEARSIVEPIRRIIRSKGKHVQFHEAECIKIDAAKKVVICKDVSKVRPKGKEEFALQYDYLVVAVGATTNTFGTKGVREYCHFLKEVYDAEKIKESIQNCFESASLPHLNKEDRQKLLSFVVVGGGPTGVEFAAELHDLIYDDLLNLYPHLHNDVKITLVQSGDHILNTYDERISKYAEQKFTREGIHVKTGCRVLGVQDGAIDFKIKSSGQLVNLPYGMIVWSTGIGTRPVVSDFMNQIGQSDRRVLATDEWLRIKNCHGTFGIGDCASIEQRRIVEDVSYLFKLADKSNSGSLTIEEFVEVMEQVRQRYPQIDIYMERQHMRGVLGLLADAVKDGNRGSMQLDIENFKQAISKVDSQMKSMPATAQVAAQQGEYLAHCFNHMAAEVHDNIAPEGPMRIRGKGRHRFQPFQYRHLGQFAPLGGEKAAYELPGDWVSIGRSTQWLWYSVYASKQVSWRTRTLVVFDWTKKMFFGRDSSRID